MESKSSSGGGGVIRREGTSEGSSRYGGPYAVTGKKYDHMKEECVEIGVRLSLCVVESMFLMCDDMQNMLLFCYMICRAVTTQGAVSQRLLRVMHHVYFNEIISKKRLHQDKICPSSVHYGVMGSAWKDFDYGIRFLHKVVMLLIRKGSPVELSNIATLDWKGYLLKKLEKKLMYAKDASEANGFARETLEFTISEIWKTLFNKEEEADAGEEKSTRIRLLCDLFQPLFGESWQPQWGKHRSPVLPLHAIAEDFEKQEELREEAVRFGVELSLYVAQSMFLVCDDIRSVLSFCNSLWVAIEKDLKQPHDSPVIERLLRVFRYVYSDHIKPKNGVYRIGGTSVQWKLVMESFEDFHVGIRDLDVFVREGNQSTSVAEALKNIEEKLRCGNAMAKANGFVRDAMESDILNMWKSLFDKPTKDLWAVKMTKFGILTDIFHPLIKERAEAKDNTLGLVTGVTNIHAGDFMKRFCSNLGISHRAVRAAEEALKKSEEFDIRRSPISIAAVVIYIITQLSDDKKPLKDIAVATGVAEGTIRNSYRDLYPHLPKITPSWYAKEEDLKNLSSP